MLAIRPIPAFEDNYIWLLHNQRDAIVIDPGDALPVLAVLRQSNLELKQILITHHHHDHIGGVATLLEHYAAQVFAPKYEKYAFNHTPVGDGDALSLEEFKLELSVMWLPGHTLGHIAYFNKESLFCGDTLFGAGCGRLFEGTPAQMLTSLNRLKTLDKNTKVYCTHEYTAKNIAFALTLDPDNPDLKNRAADVAALRAKNLPSLPSNMDLELKTNPFLRCENATICRLSGAENHDALSVFTAIRMLRNHY